MNTTPTPDAPGLQLPAPYTTATGFALYTADQMHQYARDYALSQTAGVAEGWKLVPVEPTEAMLDASMDVLPTMHALLGPKIYAAMLAAAPSAPAEVVQTAPEPLAQGDNHDSMTVLEAYAQGVNDALAGKHGAGQNPVMYQQIHRHQPNAQWTECDKATFDQYTDYHRQYGGTPPVRALYASPQPAAEGSSIGWYCSHCQRGVDASEVTYHEQHTECGRYITDDEPPTPQPSASVGATDDIALPGCEDCATNNELRRLLEQKNAIIKRLVSEDDERFALEQALTQQRGECEAVYQFRDAYGAWRDTTKAHYDIETSLDRRTLYTTPQPSADAVRELVQRWRTEKTGLSALGCANELELKLESLLGRGA